ncbi:MAG: helix-turn-helix domain-containing protein [Nitriliruptoraceae bacterium]
MTEEERSLRGPLMTVAEVAEALRVSNMTVYRLIKSGELPALRVGKNYRIRESDLEAYLATGEIRADETKG